MDVNKKYAKLMYNYLLETLLEQEQHELYVYILTVFHTGLRSADLINLTWEQYDDKLFRNVHIAKKSATYKADVYKDIYIRDSDGYKNRLCKVDVDMVGKMFDIKNKYVISALLREHTGAMIYPHDLRRLYIQLL